MPEKIFLDSKQFICESAAERLLASYTRQQECPDLGKILICLPGKLARETLIRALAEHAPHGLFPPEIVTAGVMMTMREEKANIPSDFEDQLLWYEVFSKIKEKPIDGFEKLFPSGVPLTPDLPAEQLRILRNELVHNNLSITEIADQLDLTNQERGKILAKLEAIYLETAELSGYEDPLTVERTQCSDTALLEQYEKIILLNMPDLPKMLHLRLECIEQKAPGKIEIWIHAPENCRDDYDDWGMIRKNIRTNRSVEFCNITEEYDCYELVLAPEDAANRAIQIAKTASNGKLIPDDTAIVLTDSSLLPAFQREFSKVKLKSNGTLQIYDPSGIPMSLLRFCELGNKLFDFLSRPKDFHVFSSLLRNADILTSYSKKYKITENNLLKYLDEFEQTYHPDEMDAAFTLASNKTKLLSEGIRKKIAYAFTQILQEITSLERKFNELPISIFLCEFLTNLYHGCKTLEIEQTRNITTNAEIDVIREQLAQLNKWENKQKNSTALNGTEFKLFSMKCFWKNLGLIRVPMVPEKYGYPVEGCLEIPFLTQKHVIFCGLNDGWYPDRMPSTPFLNDSIRKRLGLRCNDISFSRAICYMRTLIQTRQKAGCSVHFLVLSLNAAQDTMRPSPLFFCGNISDEELKKRVKKLFQSNPLALHDNFSDESPAPNSFFIKPDLHFRTMKGISEKQPVLSVTDFKEYLSSPLRYFLSRVLNMESTDYMIHEMNQMEFGSVCHEILEKCGDKMKSDEKVNCEQLYSTANAVFEQHYGARLPVLIGLQKEIMLQRLHATAEVFCKEFEDGYELLKFINHENEKVPVLEYQFGGPNSNGIEFHDALIRGKADRIEFNEEKKILRIIDYKTGDVKNIKEEHYTKDKKGSSFKFINLQLPLYVLLLRNDRFFFEKFRESYPDIPFENVKIETAYFVLPKAVSQTKIVPWTFEEMQEILPDAEKEVERIINEIKSMGEHVLYEDPNKHFQYDQFREMFLPNIENAVLGIKWKKDVR